MDEVVVYLKISVCHIKVRYGKAIHALLIISRYLFYHWFVLFFVKSSVISHQLHNLYHLYKQVEGLYTNVNVFHYCACSILVLRM
jgi:hypothetical protein